MGNKQNSNNNPTNINNNIKEKEKPKIIEKDSIVKFGTIEKNHFDFLYVIGKGGFGKVKNFILIK